MMKPVALFAAAAHLVGSIPEFASQVMFDVLGAVAKIRKKVNGMPKNFAKVSLNWREAYAGALHWRRLFWKKMELC